MTVFRHWTMGSRRQWLLREWRHLKWKVSITPVCCLGGFRDLPQGRQTQTEPKGVPEFSVWGGWGSWKLQGWALGRKELIRERALWRPLDGLLPSRPWMSFDQACEGSTKVETKTMGEEEQVEPFLKLAKLWEQIRFPIARQGKLCNVLG